MAFLILFNRKIRGAKGSGSVPFFFVVNVFFILIFFGYSLIFLANTYAATLFTGGFESGDFSSWTSTVTDAGDLSVTSGAALANTGYGMSVLVDDSNAIYGEYNLSTSSTTGKVRVRYYIDPNTLTMANADGFYPIVLYNSSNQTLASATLYYQTGGDYRVQFVLQLDSGNSWSDAYAITDAPHYVELYLQRATNSISGDGSLQVWVDGVSKITLTGDNYDKFANFDYVRLGAPLGLDVGTSGTFYLDELKINDDGSQIGAIDSTPPSGGSITYYDGSYASDSVILTVNDGTDSESGVNTSSRIVERKSATLSGGVCGQIVSRSL